MPDWLPALRWIHVLTASAWLGEVVVVNFILIPLITKYQGESRKHYVTSIFPLVFRLASVLSGITAITGAILLHFYTDGNWGMLTETHWGRCILIGGSLGLALTLFHFFMENRLAKKIGIIRGTGSDTALDDVHVKLRIVPRLGLLVITSTYFLMMYALRTL